MFNKLKQFRDLRSQAKTMQNALSQEKVNVEKNGVKITMDGNMEILSIQLSETLSKGSQEETLKNCFNDAVKSAQKMMAKKMQEMGGLPGLS